MCQKIYKKYIENSEKASKKRHDNFTKKITNFIEKLKNIEKTRHAPIPKRLVLTVLVLLVLGYGFDWY